jgi:hypothetical protein
MKQKKGALGESLMMIYRFLLVTLIAVVILGASNIFYQLEIDTRDTEAQLLTRHIHNCLTPLEQKIITETFEPLSHCNIKGHYEKMYIKGEIYDDKGTLQQSFEQGDSGANWVQQLTSEIKGTNFEQYETGIHKATYTLTTNNSLQNIKYTTYIIA